MASFEMAEKCMGRVRMPSFEQRTRLVGVSEKSQGSCRYLHHNLFLQQPCHLQFNEDNSGFRTNAHTSTTPWCFKQMPHQCPFLSSPVLPFRFCVFSHQEAHPLPIPVLRSKARPLSPAASLGRGESQLRKPPTRGTSQFSATIGDPQPTYAASQSGSCSSIRYIG